MAAFAQTPTQNALKAFSEVSSFGSQQVRIFSIARRSGFGDHALSLPALRFHGRGSRHRKLERNASEGSPVSASFSGEGSLSKEEMRWKREEERWRRENERWMREEERWEREEQRWNRIRTQMSEREAHLQGQINQIKDMMAGVITSQQDLQAKMKPSPVEDLNPSTRRRRSISPGRRSSEDFDERFDLDPDHIEPEIKPRSTLKYKYDQATKTSNLPVEKLNFLDDFDLPSKFGLLEPSRFDVSDKYPVNRKSPDDDFDDFEDDLDLSKSNLEDPKFNDDVDSPVSFQKSYDGPDRSYGSNPALEFPHRYSRFDFSDDVAKPKSISDFDSVDDFAESHDMSGKIPSPRFDFQNGSSEAIVDYSESNGSYIGDDFNPLDTHDVDKLIQDLKAKKMTEASRISRDIQIANDVKKGKKLQIPKGWKVLDILSEGEDVRKMQNALRSLGFIICKEEWEMAYFSFDTETAFKRWQSSIGMEPDGLVTYEQFQLLLQEASLS